MHFRNLGGFAAVSLALATSVGAITTTAPEPRKSGPAPTALPSVLGLTAWDGSLSPVDLSVNWVAGVRLVWSDAEPVKGQLDWTRLDAAIHLVDRHATAIPVLVPTSPWAGGEKPAKAKEFDIVAPADLEAWAAFVGKVVERYDGDGIDDMPGLQHPIKDWQMMPDLLDTWASLANDTVDYLDATARAIVGADPRASAILGSITEADVDYLSVQTGAHQGLIVGGERITKGILRATSDLLERVTRLETVLGRAAKAFTTVDVHHLTSGPGVAERLQFLDSLLNKAGGRRKRIWSLYNAVPSIPNAMPDEASVASEMVRTALVSLLSGCRRFAWPANGSQMPPAATAQIYALMDRAGNIHAAQQAFADLAGRLAGLEQMTVQRPPTEAQSVMIVAVTSTTSEPFSAVWSEDNATIKAAFETTGPVTVKPALGGETKRLEPVDGKVTLEVGPYPIYVTGLKPAPAGKR